MRIRTTLLTGISILLSCAGCSNKVTIRQTENRQYVFTDTSNNNIDSSVYLAVRPLHDSLQQIMNEPLAISKSPLTKALPESTLGDFVADACASVAMKVFPKMLLPVPDFVMLNQGGLRSSLPSGTITLGNVYELMPFENELVMLKLNSEETMKLLNYIAARGGNPVAGLRMRIIDKEAEDITVHGQPFTESRSYYVVTSDYLANGGDNLDFLKSVNERYPSGIKVRDAITQYLRDISAAGDTLNPVTDGRISK